MRRKSLWLLAGLLVALAVAVALLLVGLRQGSIPEASRDATPPASTTPSPSPSPALTWTDVGGVQVPTSRTHGPRDERDGLATGFSESEPGAALAAAHLLIRTGPTVGPGVFEPTIASRATGANVAALKATTNELYAEIGEQSPAASGTRLVGYLVRSFASDPGSATVDVILTSPTLEQSGRSLQTTVSLEWINGDWWVVAPPLGDWGQVSTPIGELPAGLQRYEDIS